MLFALANIVVIDLVTNSVTEFQGVSWDFARYIDMAENGIRNNPNLIAPFAYRPLNPLLAGWLMRFFNFSTWKAFKLIAWAGAALNLLTLYWTLVRMGYKSKDILIVLEIVSLQFFQIKFLMFDPFRPDHLIFPLINLAYLALIANLPILLAIIVSLGLFVREFIILPLAVYLVDFVKNKRGKFVIPILVLLMFATVFAGIRIFIPVQGSEAFLELNSADKFMRSFVNILLDGKRNINILMCLAGYTLPLLMVFTPTRWKIAWKKSGSYYLWIIVHAVCTMILTMVGGTDLGRFIVFLYLPFAILFVSLLKSGKISPLELLVVLIGVTIFNRIPWKVPTVSLESYIDFYGGYGSRINLQTGLRFLEILGWVAISQVLRILIKSKAPSVLNNKSVE
jgi:hypothetical protein